MIFTVILLSILSTIPFILLGVISLIDKRHQAAQMRRDWEWIDQYPHRSVR